MSENRNDPRIPEFDGVRGLAALLVVYQHMFLMWIPAPNPWVFWLRTATNISSTGVVLFFVVSGFLIGGSLLRNREASNYFQVFHARRVSRILPPYFFLLAVYFFIRYVTTIGQSESFDTGRVPEWSFLVLLQNFAMAIFGDPGGEVLAITWSIALQEQFYLMIPFLIRFAPRRWHFALLCLLTLIGPAVRFFTPPAQTAVAIEALFTGVILAYLQIHYPRMFSSKRWLAFACVAFAFCGCATAVALAGKNLELFREVIYTAFWTVFLWLIIGFSGTPWVAVFRMRGLREIGIISYGLYLFHTLIYHVIFLLVAKREPTSQAGPFGFMLAVISFIAALVFCWFSYHFVEQRLIQIGQRFKYSRKPRAGLEPGRAEMAL